MRRNTSGSMDLLPIVLLLLLLGTSSRLLVSGGTSDGRLDCPSMCTCSWWLILPKASCTGQRLYSVDSGVSNAIQAVDFSNNSISKLEDRELSRAGLTRLRYLNLSTNAISEIGSHAFENLWNLTILDLSWNRIDYIEPDTFYHVRLRILHLAGNKFNLHVPMLHSATITELYLSDCRIMRLPKDTFQGLKQLRILDLSKNQLHELDQSVLRVMPFLRNLSLNRNSWTCDAPMYALKIYLRTKNVSTDAFCERPGLSAKFEKLILQTVTNRAEPTEPIDSDISESSDHWEIENWKEIEQALQERRATAEEDADSGASGIFAGALSNVSPFWFLLLGFLLGSGATMVVTYLWLSTTISCLIPRIRRAEAAESTDASSQRVSLLRHLWQQESMANSEDSSTTGNHGSTIVLPGSTQTLTTPSCPGTPPPPYREVMLHRNLYPRAAMQAAAQQAGRTNDSQIYNI